MVQFMNNPYAEGRNDFKRWASSNYVNLNIGIFNLHLNRRSHMSRHSYLPNYAQSKIVRFLLDLLLIRLHSCMNSYILTLKILLPRYNYGINVL